MFKKNVKKLGVAISLATTFTFSLLEARPSIKQFDAKQEAVFEFLADDMEYSQSIIVGKGHATVINLDYYISANKAVYNTKTREITLSGDVNAYKGNALYLRAQEVKIKLQEDYSFLEPFYMQDSTTGLWVEAKSAEYDKDVYKIQDVAISTCSVNNPIWKLKADEGKYDTNKEWLTLWHPRLCVYDVPVLYFPYLSFSAGYKRKSGLLYPVLGNSKDDGIIYSQPIYFAPYNWWDMTLIPTMRTKRGGGVYGEFRVIDDKSQMLWANFGYFGDSNSYQNTYNLENQEHFGFQLEYTRKDLLTDVQNYFYEDGLYADISQVSDIDYFRLTDDKARERADLQGSLLTTRLNYFLKSDSDYIGIYGRYYSDLESTSNAKTLQTLPQVQYHRQIDKLFIEDLYYSFDYQIKHFTRPIGYRAVQQEAQLPILFTQSFADDYLNVSLSPVFYATQVNYNNIDDGLHLATGRYITQHYQFKANTDLVKQYENFGHTLNLETFYTLPGFEDKKGSFTTFFALPGDKQELRFSASQHFYDTNNILKLSHRMRQYFYLEDKHKVGELENEVQYFYNHEWSLLSDIFYAHSENRISEATHKINYNREYLNAYFGHFFRDSFAKTDWSRGRYGEANYIMAGVEKDFANLNLFASLGYDYKEDYFKTWQVGFETSVRCFSFGLKYVSEIYPMLTTHGARARDDRYALLTIKFIPLLSSDVKVGR
ncbi:LPS-assembly protein LptD [Helicobacter turcicus]|uniref:LPS assembly protein LptD n=1 Tax=Helicobacter turcicus TaxID=2867412 RepID=A0ABS7JP70_9HELI|nr:LPS assembly protein LptD [Helicobacter turcicus]MBX7491180.1 LPS assembly protein LptD [Helicobacter turcicus]MBX7546047.1 LPS assembly protein LptD [Helicobacter turcicus]